MVLNGPANLLHGGLHRSFIVGVEVNIGQLLLRSQVQGHTLLKGLPLFLVEPGACRQAPEFLLQDFVRHAELLCFRDQGGHMVTNAAVEVDSLQL